MKKRLLCIFIIFSTSISTYGQIEMNNFDEKMRSHTTMVKAHDSNYAYGYIMRKLFTYIKFGKTYGLSDSDINTIKELDGTDNNKRFDKAKQAVSLYMDDIAIALKEQQDSTTLALLWEEVREADQQSNNEYYRDIVQQLSRAGQQTISEVYTQELDIVEIPSTDFVSIAEESPEDIRTMLQAALDSYNDIKKADETIYGIESRNNMKGDNDEK